MTAEYSRFFHHERLKKVFFLTVKDDQTVTLQYTGMHSSLLITEIFQNILDILIMEGAEGTIASLARTCRTFHDASLDILWFEQLGLLHLVRCMPSDLWVESEGIVQFCRAPGPADWERYKHYAHRIRRLGQCTRYHGNKFAHRNYRGLLSEEVIHLLADCKPAFALLPNLRFLLWSEWTRTIFPCIQAFLCGSHLVALDFDFEDDLRCPPEKGLVLSTFLSVNHAIQARLGSTVDYSASGRLRLWPEIEYLDLRPPIPMNSVPASEIVCRLSYLRGFNSNTLLTMEAYKHLSALRDLWRIGLSLPADSGMAFAHFTKSEAVNAFVSLHQLYVYSENIHACEALFKSLFMTCPLQSLTLLLDPHSLSHLQGLLSTLCAARWTDSLTALNIECYDVLLSDHDYLSVKEELSRLFAMKNLRELVIRLPRSFWLDDKFLEEASRNWREIRILDLRHWATPMSEATVIPSQPSLNGLLSLIMNCPELTVAGLTVNFVTEAEGSEGNLHFHNYNLKELILDNSQLNDPDRVFKCLSDVLPNLQTISLFKSADDTGQRPLGHWEEFVNLLKHKNGQMLFVGH